MRDLKESYPVELVIYTKENKIEDKPALAQWVPYIFPRKQKRILQKR